ncbi:hypothetical protein FRC09_014230 [Ceratobasidium sp. 395]|nr:hypothetical protein FRC09_014230 [Ceratobasidium sp. 395]
MTKPEGRSHNIVSLSAGGLTKHYQEDPTLKDLIERQRELIFRAVNVLNREQELSAPLVVTYLMGWDDYYSSHYYSSIYWSTFDSHIKNTHEDLYKTDTTDETTKENNEHVTTEATNGLSTGGAEDDNTQSENVILEFNRSGKVYHKSQVDDYRYRGEEAAGYNVLDYFVNTYEQPKQRQKTNADLATAEVQTNVSTVDDSPQGTDVNKRGRPPHEQITYQEQHPRHETHIRVIRPKTHNHIPNMIGVQFPRRSDPTQSNYYAASILTFLKP